MERNYRALVKDLRGVQEEIEGRISADITRVEVEELITKLTTCFDAYKDAATDVLAQQNVADSDSERVAEQYRKFDTDKHVYLAKLQDRLLTVDQTEVDANSEDDAEEHAVAANNVETAEERLQRVRDRLQHLEEENAALRATAQQSQAVNTASDDHNLADAVTAMTELARTLTHDRNLPRIESQKFDSKPQNYNTFITSFEVNIVAKMNNDYPRLLSYLIANCTGEAFYDIKDCVNFEPEEGYNMARDILYRYYGKPSIVAQAFLSKVLSGPTLDKNDAKGLLNLSKEMTRCETNLSQNGYFSDFDNSHTLRKIANRLPFHIRSRWAEKAFEIEEEGSTPKFSDLSKFIMNRAHLLQSTHGRDLVSQSNSKFRPNKSHNQNSKPTTLATDGTRNRQYVPRKCHICQGDCVYPTRCKKFMGYNIEQRKRVIVDNQMCLNCLFGNHTVSSCFKENQCREEGCKSRLSPLLHIHNSSKGQNVSCTTNGSISNAKVALCIVAVKVKANGKTFDTYAMLDDGSNVTLCDKRLLSKLELSGRPTPFSVATLNEKCVTYQSVNVQLTVTSLDGRNKLRLNDVNSVDKLPVTLSSMPTAAEIRNYPHLRGVNVPRVSQNDVMLLIGADVPDAHYTIESRKGNIGQPIARLTPLGWTVTGKLNSRSRARKTVNHIMSVQPELDQQLERFYNADVIDSKQQKVLSVDDRYALSQMEDSTRKVDGHYCLGLPWRKEGGDLKNNRSIAVKRLASLKQKLSKDDVLCQKYNDTVQGYITSGYAERVTTKTSERVWYLPHHPVCNPNKPKVRVVFDCAARFMGQSLNDQLLQGPDYMNSLVGVLIRFRQEHVALMSDIEAMFHQVKVSPHDCDMLRFLWWPNGDMSKEPVDYRMLVHIFGATSSPSCAGYALSRTADDNKSDYSPEAISTVQKNTYVDDFLKSVPSDDDAIKLTSELPSLLQRGGFRLTKWLSNSKNVLASVPETERASSVSLNLGDSLPCDSALGNKWNVERDTIEFDVTVKDKPVNRRGILSVTSSLFDPLGLVAPVTLQAKAIMQRLCKEKLGWDEPIGSLDAIEWRSWLDELQNLKNVSINRCYKPKGFATPTSTELHVFSDASENGYGACVYVRLANQDSVVTQLVLGKSKVAPIKTTSIVRLELTAAVTACRIYELVMDELEYDVDHVTFWTDSTVVLGYIRNRTKRFKTFVANRVAVIHEITNVEQWRHVPGTLNPADLASRGIRAADTRQLDLWVNGPAFLKEEANQWPVDITIGGVRNDDPEIRQEAVVNLVLGADCLEELILRYSDWSKLKRAVAWLLRFKKYLQARTNPYISVSTSIFTADEIIEAERALVRYAQRVSYGRELVQLRHNKNVLHDSSLAKFSPIIKDDIIVVGGRLDNSNLPFKAKHQALLPVGSHVTDLIIQYVHNTNGHVGCNQVLALIREQYWIEKGVAAVKRVINNCMGCRRRNKGLMQQMMAPLPAERLESDKPPFTNVGVDYFGPLLVRHGRGSCKRYGCVFTCLTTRAVHIEIAHSLDTDSFIGAFQRFVSRRGRPSVVISDNGTNFTAGERELREAINNLNKSKIKETLIQERIDWRFNPPYASHMGGVWERIIRSIRRILKALVGEQLLTDEALLTFMAEVERILNDRPLTRVSNDPDDLEPLTPSKLLLLRSNSSVPYGTFNADDLYSRRWWHQVQYLSDLFWQRWIKEYLPTLQARNKWRNPVENIKEGDLVLISDDRVPRAQWPLAVVSDVKPGSDGLVRSVTLRSKSGRLVRPITRLCLLEGSQ